MMGAVILDRMGGRIFWEVVMLSKEHKEGRMSGWEASEAEGDRKKQVQGPKGSRQPTSDSGKDTPSSGQTAYAWARSMASRWWAAYQTSLPPRAGRWAERAVHSHTKPLLVIYAWDLEEQQEGWYRWRGERIESGRIVTSNLSLKRLLI